MKCEIGEFRTLLAPQLGYQGGVLRPDGDDDSVVGVGGGGECSQRLPTHTFHS
jgi:hypothetical protein